MPNGTSDPGVPPDEDPGEALRLVVCASAEDFIDAVRESDDPFMNWALGIATERAAEPARSPEASNGHPPSDHAGPEDSDVFAAIFQGTQLILALAHTTKRAPYFLCHPTTAPPALIAPACALLATSPVLSVPLTRAKSFGGPRAVLSALSASPHLTLSPTPSHTATACSATRATLPTAPAPLRDAPAGEEGRHYLVENAEARDALALLPLAHAFAAHAPGPAPSSHALLAVFRAAITEGALYVARTAGGQDEADIVAYLLLGRNTPRTVAIRNVFVARAHRRRGLAQALVCAVTRACLGAAPLPTEPPGVRVEVRAPEWGTKDVVCLLVAEPAVARIYARCGFVVDLEARDAETGRALCYVQELRDVVSAM